MNIRTNTKGKRPLRSLNPSDKVHAIQRIHDGESKASVARDIGVPESTLRGWCKNEEKLRFMSQQSTSAKMGGNILTDKIDGNTNLLNITLDKRQRMDTSMPLNFSNKIKFDDLTGFKPVTEFGNSHGLPPDYMSFNGPGKNLVFRSGISPPADQSGASASPLSSLSEFAGFPVLPHLPVTSNFNPIATQLLAHFNPSLAALSGFKNNFVNATETIRPANMKSKSQMPSPRGDNTERHNAIAVKNWAKQKPSTPTSSEYPSFGVNVSENEITKCQLKNSFMQPQMGSNMPSQPFPDETLVWLKSQTGFLNFNGLYIPPSPINSTSPPIRPSTPQMQLVHANTPPIIPTPLTPSSTPSASLDDKNAPVFNWYKALSELSPAALAALKKTLSNQTSSDVSGNDPLENRDTQGVEKTGFINILYSELTKESAPSPSVQSSSSVEQINCDLPHNSEMYKVEDLSAKMSNAKRLVGSPLPTPDQSPDMKDEQQNSDQNSAIQSSIPVDYGADIPKLEPNEKSTNSVEDCRDVLDNLLFKINDNSYNNGNHGRQVLPILSESETSCNSDRINADEYSLNNNTSSNKTDEEMHSKYDDMYEEKDMDPEHKEAISHGEKFLQWLENCNTINVNAVQLMQLRLLISSVKTVVESNLKEARDTSGLATTIEIDDSSEESNRSKNRRRK